MNGVGHNSQQIVEMRGSTLNVRFAATAKNSERDAGITLRLTNHKNQTMVNGDLLRMNSTQINRQKLT